MWRWWFWWVEELEWGARGEDIGIADVALASLCSFAAGCPPSAAVTASVSAVTAACRGNGIGDDIVGKWDLRSEGRKRERARGKTTELRLSVLMTRNSCLEP